MTLLHKVFTRIDSKICEVAGLGSSFVSLSAQIRCYSQGLLCLRNASKCSKAGTMLQDDQNVVTSATVLKS